MRNRDILELIDASSGRRLSLDAYLYGVEVLLLLNSQVGGCGRGEGRSVGEDPKDRPDTKIVQRTVNITIGARNIT
jgi:hypothetical protein